MNQNIIEECKRYKLVYRDESVLGKIKHKLVKLDIRLAYYFIKRKSDFKNKFWSFISTFGTYYFWFIVISLLDIFNLIGLVIPLIISGVSGILVILLLKRKYFRCRPYETLENFNPVALATNTSFPSGHVYIATIFGVTIALSLTNPVLLFISLFIGMFVGVSRLYLGVNYFTDVIFSYFTAILHATVVWIILKFLILPLF